MRDFNASHPDFEKAIAAEYQLVLPQLGPNRKPVPNPAKIPSKTVNSVNSFNQWYNDVPGVNTAKTINVTLTLNSGKYTYYSTEFFPIDGQLFGNEGRNHNFHFTFELHGYFAYSGSYYFTFAGDDDMWVYINNTLGSVYSAVSVTNFLDSH